MLYFELSIFNHAAFSTTALLTVVLQQILQLRYFHWQAHLTCRVQLMQYYLCNFHLLQFSIRVFAFYCNWKLEAK